MALPSKSLQYHIVCLSSLLKHNELIQINSSIVMIYELWLIQCAWFILIILIDNILVFLIVETNESKKFYQYQWYHFVPLCYRSLGRTFNVNVFKNKLFATIIIICTCITNFFSYHFKLAIIKSDFQPKFLTNDQTKSVFEKR